MKYLASFYRSAEHFFWRRCKVNKPLIAIPAKDLIDVTDLNFRDLASLRTVTQMDHDIHVLGMVPTI